MIKRGQIFVWSGDTPFISNAIKRLTNSKWSHAGWILNENEVLEAEWNGVVINSINSYKEFIGDRFIVLDLPLEAEIVEKCLVKASSYVGRAGYDYRLVASLGLALLTGKRCHSDLRDWHEAFICSELVATPLWEEANFRFLPDKFSIEATVPGDIWNKLHDLDLKNDVKNDSADELLAKIDATTDSVIKKEDTT